MFKIIKEVEVPEYDGKAVLYRHDCGMEVLHIKNNSEELCGNFIFSTVSEDDTGVAHILEHTVLSGSAKYPVKDPFSEILLTSPNTYLNAMTFPDKTMYPFASPLKKDFDIIFDIYADAVFNPLLRRESFNQEGVRFFGSSIDGVVFNEMRGAYSSEDDIVGRYSVKKLFEGTPAAFDSGGDPASIPDLTYENYLARYKKWYSPANCRLFLYGNMDASEYLDRIEKQYLTEKHLKDCSNVKYFALTSNYMNPEAKPETDVRFCSTKDASNILLNWLTTPADDPFEILTLSVLTDILLGNPGAPLYRAITESGLGEDLSPCSGMESDFPILTFSVGFTGAKKNSEKEIEQFILSKLEEFAVNGIDEDQKKACLKRQKYKLLEIPGGEYPYGILVGLRASRYWLRGKDPIENINNKALFERLQKECEKGPYFENWIMKNLVKNPRRCLLTVKEDKNFEAGLQKVLDAKYIALKDSMDPLLYEEEKKHFEDFINREDAEEDLCKIPRISKADLPENIPHFALEHYESNGADVRFLNTFTRGICYYNIALDGIGLDEEELKLLPLFSRCIQLCGTKKHSYSEIGVLIKMFTGRFSVVGTSGTRHDGQPVLYTVIRGSSLVEDLPSALDMVREILLECNFDDTERISASITDLVTDYESEYIDSGTAYASIYSQAQLSYMGRVIDLQVGTSGYLELVKYLDADGPTLKEISNKLIRLRDRIVCTDKMIFEYCCDECDNGFVSREINRSLASYPRGEKARVNDLYKADFTPDYRQKFLAVSSSPAFNALSCKLPFDDERKLVGATLIASIFSNGIMWENIRGKGGAYGAGCNVDMSEKTLMCYSYRDPNIDATFDCFAKVFESEISDRDIDFTVAAVIGKELKPFVPRSRNYEAFRRSLYGLTDELYLERRKHILSLGKDELDEICRELHDLIVKTGAKASVCGKDMIKTSDADVLNLPI